MGYDMCSRLRDDLNYGVTNYRYFCSEKYERDSSFNYNHNYNDGFYDDVANDWEDDYYDDSNDWEDDYYYNWELKLSDSNKDYK